MIAVKEQIPSQRVGSQIGGSVEHEIIRSPGDKISILLSSDLYISIQMLIRMQVILFCNLFTSDMDKIYCNLRVCCSVVV